MSRDSNYSLQILDKLNDLSERNARVETRIEAIETDIKEIKIGDEHQNKLLAEHIAGVQTNQERITQEVKSREDFQERMLDIKKGLTEAVDELRAENKELKVEINDLKAIPNFLKSLKQIFTGVKGIIFFLACLAGLISTLMAIGLI